MCGIVGLLAPGQAGPALEQTLTPLLHALHHRGPDGGGIHAMPGAALGMRRLALIDAEGGHQPMFSPDREIVLVYNGEIYNHDELRRELEAKGHTFRTRSDTEVLLEAYRAWGADALPRLNGIFAFALLDKARRILLLARDPFGLKPLYLLQQPGVLAFCSEPAPLLALHPNARIDPAGLALYLAHKYLPAPHTLVTGLRKLPPGCSLTLPLEAPHQGREEVYFQLTPEAPPRTQGEALERLRGHLLTAVKRQLVADSPVGVFLSGGIDSGLLLWAARQGGADPLAVTAGFADPFFDERAASAVTARHLKARHHIEAVPMPDPAQLARWVTAFGEPFANVSIPAQFAVCRAAAAHGKAALNGAGGDELFGGYDRYYAVAPPGALRWAAQAAPLLRPLLACLPAGQGSKVARGRVFLELAGLSPAERHARSVRLFSSEALTRLIPHLPLQPDAVVAAYLASPGRDPLQRASGADIATMLAEDYLLLVDRVGMAASLEVRAPFLDLDLARFAWSLPQAMKIHGWEKKRLLRQLAAQVLPPETARRRKRGFETPVEGWYRGPLGEALLELLGEAPVGEVLDRREVEALLTRHRHGQEDGARRLLGLHTLLLWSQERRLGV